MLTLLFATSNAHKTQEIAAMLGDGWQVQSLRAYPDVTLPEETGTTFEANAIIKAQGASAALPGVLILADDSGLEVDALDGAPGVWSARYAGEGATDADNRDKLKAALRALPNAERAPFTGRFRCCLALVKNEQVLHVTHGAVEGTLRLEEQGAGGFGYDTLFQPLGYEDTFGVLPAEVKNSLSHRARAMAEMQAWLTDNLQAVS
jgi:XTP/dITP diphosphohydrolase